MMKFLQNHGDKLLALFTAGVSLAQNMGVLDTLSPATVKWIVFGGAFATLAHTVLVSPTATDAAVPSSNPTKR